MLLVSSYIYYTKCSVSLPIRASNPQIATTVLCGVRLKLRSYVGKLWRTDGNPWIIYLKYSFSIHWEVESSCAQATNNKLLGVKDV